MIRRYNDLRGQTLHYESQSCKMDRKLLQPVPGSPNARSLERQRLVEAKVAGEAVPQHSCCHSALGEAVEGVLFRDPGCWCWSSSATALEVSTCRGACPKIEPDTL